MIGLTTGVHMSIFGKKNKSCAQLGEFIGDGVDEGFVSLLADLREHKENLGACPEKIVTEVAYLKLFIVERTVDFFIPKREFQEAILLACVQRVMGLSKVLPEGSAFQDAYDSRWETYNNYWRDPLDSGASMALAGHAATFCGAGTHSELIMQLVELIAADYAHLIALIRDYQTKFLLTA